MAKAQTTPAVDDRVYEVEERTISVRGKEERIFIRELLAIEAENIFGGYNKGDTKAVFRVRKMVVSACICTEDGKRRFLTTAAVDTELTNTRINAYFKEASEVNEFGKDKNEGKDPEAAPASDN